MKKHYGDMKSKKFTKNTLRICCGYAIIICNVYLFVNKARNIQDSQQRQQDPIRFPTDSENVTEYPLESGITVETVVCLRKQ